MALESSIPHLLDSPEGARDPEVVRNAERNAEQVLESARVIAGTREQLARLEGAVRRSEVFATWMDKRLLDPVLSMLPVAGDTATGIAGLYIVAEALRAGVPKAKILKMLVNIGVDIAAGSIPVAGDIFDFFWKANLKNAAILRQYMEQLKSELA